MIKYHPTTEVLQRFAAGELPASVSIIVASHVETCVDCREQVEAITAEMAQQLFSQESAAEQTSLVDVPYNAISSQEHLADQIAIEDPLADSDALAMINSIISEQEDSATIELQSKDKLPERQEIDVAGKRLVLPQAMRSIALKEWQTLGKLSRSRLALEDDNLRMSLLSIESGGGIPSHSHNGFEITLLLQGSFDDEMGHYAAGDFIWLDGEHNHTPVTQEGCVCLTVSSDSLHFTKGLSQLINPMGKFIY